MKRILSCLLAASINLAAQEKSATPRTYNPQGWSFDLGGQYTWMSFTTPPTFRQSTGGVVGKITYQAEKAYFGQLRSIYNLGKLSSSVTTSHDYEWYTEIVGGYCFKNVARWRFTPYLGLGLDFLKDKKKGYASYPSIDLNYHTYYALVGLDVQYALHRWTIGAQAEMLPVFDQTLQISSLKKQAWILKQRVGVAARLPVAYQICKKIWVELAPYYRLMPLGSSSVLSTSDRNLEEWGAFLSFRFYL